MKSLENRKAKEIPEKTTAWTSYILVAEIAMFFGESRFDRAEQLCLTHLRTTILLWPAGCRQRFWSYDLKRYINVIIIIIIIYYATGALTRVNQPLSVVEWMGWGGDRSKSCECLLTSRSIFSLTHQGATRGEWGRICDCFIVAEMKSSKNWKAKDSKKQYSGNRNAVVTKSSFFSHRPS